MKILLLIWFSYKRVQWKKSIAFRIHKLCMQTAGDFELQDRWKYRKTVTFSQEPPPIHCRMAGCLPCCHGLLASTSTLWPLLTQLTGAGGWDNAASSTINESNFKCGFSSTVVWESPLLWEETRKEKCSLKFRFCVAQ